MQIVARERSKQENCKFSFPLFLSKNVAIPALTSCKELDKSLHESSSKFDNSQYGSFTISLFLAIFYDSVTIVE